MSQQQAHGHRAEPSPFYFPQANPGENLLVGRRSPTNQAVQEGKSSLSRKHTTAKPPGPPLEQGKRLPQGAAPRMHWAHPKLGLWLARMGERLLEAAQASLGT